MGDQRAAFRMPAIFSSRPIMPSQIPPDGTLIQDTQIVLQASLSWKAGIPVEGGRTFVHQQPESETTSKRKKTQSWHCIVKQIQKDDQVSFHNLWAKIRRNKTENQKSYVATVSRVTLVKYISEWQSIWTISFTYPPPMSPRVFTVYQASWLLEYSHRRSGIVVTLPVDLSERTTSELMILEEKGVKGHWVSIEHLQEIEDGMMEWRRIACLDSKGIVPSFWVNRKLEKRMMEEAKFCIEYSSLKQEDDEGYYPQQDVTHYGGSGTSTEIASR